MTLAEAKMCTFTLESTHFNFNKCPNIDCASASAKFRTNSQETDYSAGLALIVTKRITVYHMMHAGVTEVCCCAGCHAVLASLRGAWD